MVTLFLSKGQVWKRVWILEVWSENGSGKLHSLVWNRVTIWRNGRHTPIINSQEYPPGISTKEDSSSVEKPVEKSDRLLPRAAVPAWEKTGLGSLAWKAH